MVTPLLAAFFVGLLLVGSSTLRVVEVAKGEILNTFLISIIISFAYWFSIQYIAQNDIGSYVAFSLGACIATVSLAHRESNSPNKGLLARHGVRGVGSEMPEEKTSSKRINGFFREEETS